MARGLGPQRVANPDRVGAGAAPGEGESPTCEDSRRHGCRQAARRRADGPSAARRPSGEESSAVSRHTPLIEAACAAVRDPVAGAGGATTADILSLMAEGRRRVHERFGISLEPEVQVLGEVEWPEAWDLS